MLIKFSFSNFRSIRDEVTLSFEASKSSDLEDYYVMNPIPKLRLLKLGVIYGANASGKTNILKALDFLRTLVIQPLEKKTDKIHYDRFAFDESSQVENSTFEIEFIRNGIRYTYSLALNNQTIVEEKLYFYDPNKALVYARKTDETKQLSSLQLGGKIKDSIKSEAKNTLEANTLWNNTVLGGYLKTNIDSEHLQNVISWFKDYLAALITPRTDLLGFISLQIENKKIRKEMVIDILKKADFKISDILIEERDISPGMLTILKALDLDIEDSRKIQNREISNLKSKGIIFEHAFSLEDKLKTYSLDYADESQGTQRFYQFAGLIDLMMQEGKFFMIDELESSLHPDLIVHFLLTFLINTTDSQLLITTHFRELLREQDILRNDVIKFCDKGKGGETELYAFTDFDSSVVRSTSSIYNAYKIGKLGAVPFLSDHYLPQD